MPVQVNAAERAAVLRSIEVERFVHESGPRRLLATGLYEATVHGHYRNVIVCTSLPLRLYSSAWAHDVLIGGTLPSIWRAPAPALGHKCGRL